MAGDSKQQLAAIRSTVDANLVLLKRCETEQQQLAEKIANEKKNQVIYAQATKILRDLYEQTQERFHGQIMQIVSYCLKEVFGDDAYKFKINFVQKRNQVEASFVFVRDGEEYDPLQAAGGGVLAVACFALRLAVLYLMSNQVRHIMVLDEPFGQLSVGYRDAMATLLTKLADEFDFQFILITHASEFEMGKVYRLSRDGIESEQVTRDTEADSSV